MIQGIAIDINKMKRDCLQRECRSWLSPPDPSPNYNTAREIHQDGTAMWFCEGSVLAEWNTKGSLLWIHGKPGSGKTILISTVIREIDSMPQRKERNGETFQRRAAPAAYRIRKWTT
ncbi:hypothetical protein EI94DRAFT_812072 [Lactarius quietus]|nr:hypothetical protein EI94DRAFT_812072 [Lactarius quietus]